MIRAGFLCVALVAGIGLGIAAKPKAPFGDLSDDSDKPINISAETQQADFNAETITYTGAVRIQQGDLTLRADTVTAAVPNSKLSRVTASGDVVITSQDATARAPLAVYEVTARTIRLTGDVVLTQGSSTLRGTDLLVDIEAGTAVLTGKGSSSGRVEGILQPGDAKTQ